ncbi:tRNA (cytosine(72)-C(5))-methyltransferase NSUN6 [Colias croceus]|uniref:tRNA (cytosine(72)-C(5))-methyltransferase NSUN6 n=1 Tax=Colias crocea TaxID=72248 RepID=UPI001E27F063|nr:tRNA (cytosine(72)-C(5))-methyltransferase NSUN6 [Colias croceus]
MVMKLLNSIQNWLEKTPNHTCFRVNKLKVFDIQNLQSIFVNQSEELSTSTLPEYNFLKSDCLIVKPWSDNVVVKQDNSKVMVDASCGAAVLRGSHVFAPGVLGLQTSCQLNDLVDIYADLDGKCKRGLKIDYNGKKEYVGTGYLKKLRRDLFDEGIQPSGIGIQTLLPASKLPVINESLFPQGQVLLQNLPSIVCGWVVNAKPNERILDMCAAPGNKTTHLAEMSDDKAIITAIDKTEKKVDLIKQNCEIQGVTCVNAFTFDSRHCYSETASEDREGPPFPANTFDKVLLDAPCSGLGQRPRLINNMTPKMLQSYKFIQRKLLAAAVKVLKSGGKLVYSTCTVTLEENEEMVKWALDKFPCLRLVPADPLCGGPGLPDCGLNDNERLMVQRFGPEEDPLRPVDDIYRNSIGFFIAAFTKIE